VFEESFAWLDEPTSVETLDEQIEIALSRMVDKPFLPVSWVRESRFLDAAARRF
jgi:hypothetical protein